jgi:hypothetical protein
MVLFAVSNNAVGGVRPKLQKIAVCRDDTAGMVSADNKQHGEHRHLHLNNTTLGCVEHGAKLQPGR